MKNIKVYEEFISDDLENKFLNLKKKWISEVAYQSNPSIVYENSNYRNIIDIGEKIVPFLIKDLNENNGDWLSALTEILRINPVKKENEGNWDMMKENWNKYLNENGLINTTIS